MPFRQAAMAAAHPPVPPPMIATSDRISRPADSSGDASIGKNDLR